MRLSSNWHLIVNHVRVSFRNNHVFDDSRYACESFERITHLNRTIRFEYFARRKSLEEAHRASSRPFI